MKIKFTLFLFYSLSINAYSNHISNINISNSTENSHHSKLIIDNNDHLNLVWIEGTDKIYYRQYFDSTLTPIIQIYESDTLSIIQELSASMLGDSIYVFWVERTDTMSILFSCRLFMNTVFEIDTLYQTNHRISRLKSSKGKTIGWFEDNYNFWNIAAINIMTLLNQNTFLIDSCSFHDDFSICFDETDKLNVFWLDDWEVNFKTLLDTISWSSVKSIYLNGLSGKDITCKFNSISQKFNLAITGDLLTGWLNNGLIYFEGLDTTWLPYASIMPPGHTSPFQEYNISEYPEIMIHSNGKTGIFFQNTFHGQSSTTTNIYMAQKNNFDEWIIQTDLFPSSVFFNSSAIDSRDSLYCTFKKEYDIFIGGNQIITNIEINSEISNFYLNQNYPNPFNPTTTIKYTLPKSDQVIIEVFNLLGQKITTLLDKQMSAGNHSIKFTADNLPSGVYFYCVQAGQHREVRKMIFIK